MDCVFWGRFSCCEACSINVAETGVLFYGIHNFVGYRGGLENPGTPKYLLHLGSVVRKVRGRESFSVPIPKGHKLPKRCPLCHTHWHSHRIEIFLPHQWSREVTYVSRGGTRLHVFSSLGQNEWHGQAQWFAHAS